MPNASHDAMRLTIREAHLINRNFEGRAKEYNTEGDQNFCVVLDFDEAAKLKADGWLVKYDKRIEKGEPIPEGEERNPFLPVNLGYKIRAPRVVMITPNGNKIMLGQGGVGVLDWADIIKADLVVTARYWENVGKTGFKTWLKTLIVWIDEDELEAEHGLNEMLSGGGPADDEDDDLEAAV